MKITTHPPEGEQNNYIYTHKHLTGIISRRGKRWKLDIRSSKPDEVIENKSKIWSTKGKAKTRMEKIFNNYKKS